MNKIRKGDNVIVIAGKDKGRTGVILKMNLKDNTALVQGVNLVKRHQKQTQSQEGGIITKESPIHLSNIAYLDPKENKPTKIGIMVKDDKKVRFAKRSGEVING